MYQLLMAAIGQLHKGFVCVHARKNSAKMQKKHLRDMSLFYVQR